MEVNNALKHWENLGKILKRIEKHNAHRMDVDAAMQQARTLYISLVEMQESNNPDKKSVSQERTPGTQQENNANDIDSAELLHTDHETNDNNSEKDESENLSPGEKKPDKTVTSDMKEKKSKDEYKPEQKQKEKEESQQTEVKQEKKQDKKSSQKASPQPSLFKNEEQQTDSGKALGEKLGAKKMAVNETIGEKNVRNNVASKLKSKPVTDIKAAIGLGDRFLFIKELFQGNADEFNKCIKELNEVNSLEEAKQYIEKYDWNIEEGTAAYFWSIVQRRFSQA
ncbi:MAG: hypothetical protein R6V32_04550 [Bacteroidales bacterium]